MKTEYQMEIIKKYIYLLRLENSWCLYNLRSGKFAFISSQYYNKHLRNDSARKNSFEAIINPISSNYTFPPQLDSNAVNRTQLYLVLTDLCNMSCSYCRQRQDLAHTHKMMTPKVAIEIIKERAASSEGLKSVVFYGGEPLMNKATFQASVKYIRSNLSSEISISIITNGTLIDDEIASFIAQNNIYVVLSIDGCNEEHNCYRNFNTGESAFGSIIRGLETLLKYKTRVGISCTVGKHNIRDLSKIADWFHSKYSVLNICFGLPHYEQNGVLTSALTVNNIESALIEAYTDHNGFVENVYKVMRDLINGNIKTNRCPSCGGRIVALPDKTYGICTGSLVLDGAFYFDRIEDQEKLARNWRLLSSPLNDSFCQGCIAYRICGGGCPFDSYSLYSNVEEKEYRRCIIMNSTINWCFNRISQSFCNSIARAGVYYPSYDVLSNFLMDFRKGSESPLKASETFGIMK